jgi:hypothetical protein
MIEISQTQMNNLLKRTTRLEQLVEHLAYRLERERVLLNKALHELALAREASDPVHFMQRWRAEHLERERYATFTDAGTSEEATPKGYLD